MKREASDDEVQNNEGPSKRQRGGVRSTDVRFLVQSKNAGAIIGKGGSNIKRLRTEFKASVTVPDCPGPERILSIVTDLDTLGEILLDIVPKLDDYSHHRTMEFDCELRMLLHQSHAGCLIGKGGSRIKELREKTGSQIKIFSNCCPNSTERIVQITGYPNVVVNAVKEVCNIISQSPIKGPNKQYDPHHFNPMYVNEYGGYDESAKGRGRGGRGGRGGGGGFRGRNQQQQQQQSTWSNDDNYGFGGSDGFSSGLYGSRARGGGGGGGGGGAGLMGQGPGASMGGRWSQDMGMGGTGGMDRSWSNDGGDSFGNLGARNRMMGGMNNGSYMSQTGGMADKMSAMSAMGGQRASMLQGGGGNTGGLGGGFQSSSMGMGGGSNRFMGGRQQGYGGPVARS